MSDEHLRQLERAAAQGDPSATAALEAARERASLCLRCGADVEFCTPCARAFGQALLDHVKSFHRDGDYTWAGGELLAWTKAGSTFIRAGRCEREISEEDLNKGGWTAIDRALANLAQDCAMFLRASPWYAPAFLGPMPIKRADP